MIRLRPNFGGHLYVVQVFMPVVLQYYELVYSYQNSFQFIGQLKHFAHRILQLFYSASLLLLNFSLLWVYN